MLGLPQIIHSDQGHNFESTALKQMLKAFGIRKSRTTAYHPQGDGLVKRFNPSLLQLLCSLVQSEPDWERYLPLVSNDASLNYLRQLMHLIPIPTKLAYVQS